MTNEPSPRPWRVESDNLTLRPPVCFVVDANGAKVTGGFFLEADAALIVAAVNERDRLRAELADKTRNYEDVIAFHTRTEEHLRDLVKRLAEFVNDTVCFTPSDKEGAQSLLREARAAIGEHTP